MDKVSNKLIIRKIFNFNVYYSETGRNPQETSIQVKSGFNYFLNNKSQQICENRNAKKCDNIACSTLFPKLKCCYECNGYYCQECINECNCKSK
jgi:hypothetical protein